MNMTAGPTVNPVLLQFPHAKSSLFPGHQSNCEWIQMETCVRNKSVSSISETTAFQPSEDFKLKSYFDN